MADIGKRTLPLLQDVELLGFAKHSGPETQTGQQRSVTAKVGKPMAAQSLGPKSTKLNTPR
jgi:hypothetical protein